MFRPQLLAEFENDYSSLFRNIMSLCALDPRKSSSQKWAATLVVQEGDNSLLSLAEWRILRETLDQRQDEVYKLALQRSTFLSEEAFATELQKLLVCTFKLKSAKRAPGL